MFIRKNLSRFSHAQFYFPTIHSLILYLTLFTGWIDKIDLLMTFLVFPQYLHPHLYTTNWIERINKEFRKVLKTKNAFPTEDAVRNVLYFKIRDMVRKFERQKLNGFASYQVDLQLLWEKQYGRKEAMPFTQST